MKKQQQTLFSDESLGADEAAWEKAARNDHVYAQVVFNRPLQTVFHYLIPEPLREIVAPGQRVQAPFGRGNRLETGYCVGLTRALPTGRQLKSLTAVLDAEPLLSPHMLNLTRFIAEHYMCGWGQVLQSVLPAGVKKKSGTRLVRAYEPAAVARESLGDLKLPHKQLAVLTILCESVEPVGIEALTERADCGPGPINTLRKKGLIRAVTQRRSNFALEAQTVPVQKDLVLNPDQQRGLRAILDALASGKHQTILLHGATGSGKTEVYIQAIREVVAYRRQAIVLVPEISLTPQTIRRFRSRFSSVAVLHSHLSDPERHWHWQQIAEGRVQVVVGARSAVFAPTPHLGLIVIDEEHETTFKQETTPRYHARDVARQRALMEGIPLVLGSATPTLESWLRVQRKQDLLVSMPRRVENRPMPPVVVVDIRNDPHCLQGEAIGRALRSAMRIALDDDGQIILFLNLRGYSPLVFCRACGEAVTCPHCDITLTWHKDRGVVLCHSCDFATAKPRNCPKCGHAGIVYLRTGTQRLEQEVQAKFPGVACLRMDSDAMHKPGSHDEALAAFQRGEVRILLGTQMIAKGLDFPNVTLVGVIDADTPLHQPDLRAAERTFQLIAQVAGRTGRSARGGRVIVQSSSPGEPAILKAAAHDYVGFAARELEHRRRRHAPPFHHLVRVIVRGPLEKEVHAHAQQLSERLKELIANQKLPVRVLGPAVAPIARLKRLYRYHVQLTAESLEPIRSAWEAAADVLNQFSTVECVIDVDAINLR